MPVNNRWKRFQNYQGKHLKFGFRIYMLILIRLLLNVIKSVLPLY